MEINNFKIMTETTFDTTITDKDTYTADTQDTEKFNKLSDDEKEIFIKIRNSMLEIFPLTDGKHDVMSLKYAENFAFINIKSMQLAIDKIVDKKISELSTIYATQEQFNTLKSTATTATTETTT